MQEKVFVAPPSHDPLKLLQARPGAHDCETVVLVNDGRVSRGGYSFAASNARNGDARLNPARDRIGAQGVEVWIRNDQRATRPRLDRRTVLLGARRRLA